MNTVAEHYSVFIKNRHRATNDAFATAKIFKDFLLKFEEKGIKDLLSAKKFKV